MTALASAQDLDELIDEAVAANPSIAALTAKTESLNRRSEVAGAWSDPMVSVQYSNAPLPGLGLSDHPMAGLQFSAQQMLRPPSWSSVRREVLEHRASAVEQRRAEQQLQIRAAVGRAWWSLTRTRHLKTVTEKHISRTEELLAAVRARYEVGATGQHALLRLEVLRDRLTDQLGDFERQDRELAAGLRRALASDPSRTFDTPEELSIVPAPPGPDGWLASGEKHRPWLASIRAEADAAESAARLARIEGVPDPVVMAGYRMRTVTTEMDPGTDLVTVGVGVPIPTGSGRRSSGERAAQLHEAESARQRLEAALDGMQADAESIHARWTRGESKARTYANTLIPAARNTLETTQADFTVGKADFASLFDAEVALLDLERAWIVAVVATQLQKVEAHAVLGTDPGGAP